MKKHPPAPEDVSRYADMLAAMGTEPRPGMMRLLLCAHPAGMAVGEIRDELGGRRCCTISKSSRMKNYIGQAGEHVPALLREDRRQLAAGPYPARHLHFDDFAASMISAAGRQPPLWLQPPAPHRAGLPPQEVVKRCPEVSICRAHLVFTDLFHSPTARSPEAAASPECTRFVEKNACTAASP